MPANPIAEPDVDKAEKINFNFEWVGSVSENLGTDQPPSLWQINGVAWDIKDKTCADRPIAKLKLGQSYVFEFKNMTQYQHPIHLHGMSFKVLASNRKTLRGPRGGLILAKANADIEKKLNSAVFPVSPAAVRYFKPASSCSI